MNKSCDFLKNYNKSESTIKFESEQYSAFTTYVNACCSGEGMIGENSYLILWEKEEIEELNDDYEVKEFLDKCILIGSDGGDTAYGIDSNGNFFSVPFIGMDNDKITIMGSNFKEFLKNLYNS